MTNPAHVPTRSAASTATGIDHPASSSIATTVLAKAMTDPTERSKPPEASRIAMPMTMIALGVMPMVIALKLATDRKCGEASVIARTMRAIRTRSVSSRVRAIRSSKDARGAAVGCARVMDVFRPEGSLVPLAHRRLPTKGRLR